jgi:hypothetical protein
VPAGDAPPVTGTPYGVSGAAKSATPTADPKGAGSFLHTAPQPIPRKATKAKGKSKKRTICVCCN